LPPVAKPDSSAKYPEFPEPVLPLLSVTDPDTPDDAAFDDASTTAPVPLLVLPPDRIDTEPPIPPVEVVVPLERNSAAPFALFPVPTITLMDPPDPPVPEPEDKRMLPESPSAVLPVNNSIVPEEPVTPPVAVLRMTDPVELLVLAPPTINTEPPT